MKLARFLVVSAVTCSLLAVWANSVLSEDPPVPDQRATATKAMQDGNFDNALERFRLLVLNENNDSRLVGSDLSNGVQCLSRLGRVSEIDAFLEEAIRVHGDNWRFLLAAATNYQQVPHHGFMIAGEYHRGHHRGGGKMVNSLERDRVRALQLLDQALLLANQDDQKAEVAAFYSQVANLLLYNRGHHEAWRLQYLTDLTELPDYDDGHPYFRNFNGAPVDQDGQPVLHHSVPRWEDAETDGQRWQFALDQIFENAPGRLNEVRHLRATFYQQQWGVQTMAQYGYFFPRHREDDGDQDESGTYALDTLSENETIARLATGIKRFDLPDEFNFVKIFQTIVDQPATGYGEQALNQLATTFLNRRQYPKAADYWQESIRQHGNAPGKQSQIDQIIQPWGRFDSVTSQPADTGASVEFVYRNGDQVSFVAHEIKVEKLLDDVKAYLKSDPGRIDWQQVNIGNIGYRLVHQDEQQYVGDRIASWSLDLQPRDKHFDRRITVSTPLQKAGAYLVTAKMQDGNESKIVLWVSDTAIARKQLDGKSLYYVADAVGGQPIAGANLEFFGYRREHLGGNKFKIETFNFAEQTDADGQVLPDPRDLRTDVQWVVIARREDGRFAHFGFQNVWDGRYHDADYQATKIFTITDRPVYRPDQTVYFKLWVRHAQYDKEDVSQFGNMSFPLQIHNPQGERVLSQTFTTDEYGGLEGELQLPADAALGQYNINLEVHVNNSHVTSGGSTFRVEEYKNPEFEVTIDAPQEPVMLGEVISAKITARYYFGSPVVNATVKYKILRSQHSQNWYPMAPWDWCYGSGYWWPGYDYPWYRGWHDWVGCVRPMPWWWPHSPVPPEVVAEHEVEISDDGTVDVEIDTALAKEIHGDQDHAYTITAEVVDESRRTIVGTGKVLVARKPFKVFTWINHGYYRQGDTIQANFKAQTLDNQPVEGDGMLTLLKITYDQNNDPVETPVRRWDLATDSQGVAQLQVRASAKGQYRLSYKVTDAQDHTIEGGYLFTITGDGFDGADYRFNDLELIPDKLDYQPGDTVRLQVNTNRVDSTVLLFVRPSNGVYLAPQTYRLEGKSNVVEIPITKKDMPNFFVEALTISGGKIHTETKEIIVPPEKRVVNVDVIPSAEEYKPGEDATMQIRLTDFTGEPIVGSTVVTIYDKSVEYISGGSNVPDIKEFFWKWRRRHNVNTQSSLARHFGNLTLKNKPGMQHLGIFGATVAAELDTKNEKLRGGQALGGGGARRANKARGLMAPRPPMAMAAAADGAAMEGDSSFLSSLEDAVEERGADRFDDAGVVTGGSEMIEPTVRSNFADTALWVGTLETDATGMAEVALTMPENLTGWKVRVWSVSHGTKVGAGEVEVVTRKNLILRMQSPRFFVQKDEVVLSANVHNYLDSDKQVEVSLELDGPELESMTGLTQSVTIPAGGEQRVDWRVKVVAEGQATVRMLALTDEESDAMQMQFPSYVHGMLKTDSWAGTVRPDDAAGSVSIVVPAERRINDSVLEVRYSPTLAGAMVDALPYLADYPYGCTEQTLNRFLPTVITQKVLLDMNLNLAQIRDKRTNLNAQEIGDDRARAEQWKRFERNPVFDEDEVRRMVKEGLKRLTEMQISDGGWGWFSGYHERSYPHTTAVVVHGLQIAQQNDVVLVPGVLERGVAWLTTYQAQQVQWIKNWGKEDLRQKQFADNLDALCYMILADAGEQNDEMREFLYRDRNRLAVYAKAMFGLALEQQDHAEQLAMIMENISQYVVQDAENESAYLRLPQDNYWWYWYGSEVEANAYYLKLLARTDAQGETAPRLVKYLLNNRKHATYWSNTRDTAICVEAFAEYLRASEEMNPDMVVEVWVDGEKRQEAEITRENLFTFNNKFVLLGDAVADGEHQVELRRSGKGPVYYNVYLTNFTLEDFITRAGLEVKVNRKYYKLVPVDKTIKVEGQQGQAVDQKVETFERVELEHMAMLQSGDKVEIELEIDSKNDYEYVIFEDMKAAGFEPMDLRSGYSNNGLGAYMELRDNRVSFFVRALARGKHSISYRMRAEIPGRFSALPARAYAMYAPELKGNSDEIKLQIED